MMRRLAVLVLVLAPAALRGQAPPLSGPFQINTFTSGEQRDARVASSGNGFVVVWSGYYPATATQFAFQIKGQSFDDLGQPSGAEFLVNGYTTGDHAQPSIAADQAGDFVVVWDSDQQDGDERGIFGQRFALRTFPPPSQLVKVGSQFPVNTYTTSSQDEPVVALDGSGNFVVVWRSFGQDGSYSGIFGQRFGSSGARIGSEFQVNSDTVGFQESPTVGFDGAGNFVVVWETYDTIRGQRFDKSGTKKGGEFLAAPRTADGKTGPALAVRPAGDFVVVWESTTNQQFSTGLVGQCFDSSGEEVGPFFRVDGGGTAYRFEPSISGDRDGNFVVAWTDIPLDRSSYSIFAHAFDRTGAPRGAAIPIAAAGRAGLGSGSVVDSGEGLTVVWFGEGDGSVDGIFGSRQNLFPDSIQVDEGSTSETTSDVNGVLEPGETVLVQPFWRNQGALSLALTGSTPMISCLILEPCVAGADRSADYGSVPPGALAGCGDGSPDECYTVLARGTRPGTHWDGAFSENLSSGGGQVWTLHVGDSFSDVPRSEPFYKKIETLLHHGITTGCNATEYCPSVTVSRDQMAIFIAKGIAGDGEFVPRSGSLNGQTYECFMGGVSLFSDVAPTDSACRHVHYLAAQNVTLGCAAGLFCPGQPVTRDTMASFIAKAIVAPQGSAGVPKTYSDPGTGHSYSCSAGSPNIHFTDVPVSNPFCAAIHFLWAKGIVDGCSATTYCPTGPVARDAMAKFLVNAFQLKLYEP